MRLFFPQPGSTLCPSDRKQMDLLRRRSSFATHAAALLILCSAVILGFGQGWSGVFSAPFSCVPDGPGDGLRFPAELGKIRTFTGNGMSFPRVSPNSGILSNALILSDRSSQGSVDYGIECLFANSADLAVEFSFIAKLDPTDPSFSVDVTDNAGSDLCSVDVNSAGEIQVDGSSSSLRLQGAGRYSIWMSLAPTETGKGTVTIVITNLDTKETASFVIETKGSFRPVSGIRISRSGKGEGDLVLDNLLGYALGK